MLIKPECILCNYRVALMAIRELTSDENTVKELISEILQIPAVSGPDWNLTSPEMFEFVFSQISVAFNDPDPFKSLKDRQNQKALQLYPWLQTLVNESDDPLYTATKLAIIGNSVDVNWSEGSEAIERIIKDKRNTTVHMENFRALKERLEQCKLLLYFGDNSGEIVLDKLLIETIKAVRNLETIFVVRSVPTLNDVTLIEAKSVGMDETAAVMENGIDGPLPGTIPSRCSAELRDLLNEADLVISKGGGNFDSLDEEKHLRNDIFFMLMCKCIPYCRLFHTKLYEPILSNGAP